MSYLGQFNSVYDRAFRLIEDREPEPLGDIPFYDVIKTDNGFQISESDGIEETTIAMCFPTESEAWKAVDYLIETGV